MRYAKPKSTNPETPAYGGLIGLARLLARQAAREVSGSGFASSLNSSRNDDTRKSSCPTFRQAGR